MEGIREGPFRALLAESWDIEDTDFDHRFQLLSPVEKFPLRGVLSIESNVARAS